MIHPLCPSWLYVAQNIKSELKNVKALKVCQLVWFFFLQTCILSCSGVSQHLRCASHCIQFSNLWMKISWRKLFPLPFSSKAVITSLSTSCQSFFWAICLTGKIIHVGMEKILMGTTCLTFEMSSLVLATQKLLIEFKKNCKEFIVL